MGEAEELGYPVRAEFNTCSLRFVLDKGQYVLQQMWHIVTKHPNDVVEDHYEWRDVPLTVERSADKSAAPTTPTS